jgi:hypothetical protein
MLHHYTRYVEEEVVREAEIEVVDLLADYEAIENKTFPNHKQGDESSQQTDSRLLFPAF